MSRGAFVGLTTLDLVYRLDGPARPNFKNIVTQQGVFAGGPAANAAVAFAALGGDADLLTAIGRHPLAELIRADLSTQRVAVRDLIPEHDGLPCIASVLVSPGGDRLAASTGANLLPPQPLDFTAVPQPCPGVMLVDGHLLETCIVAARQARQAGVPVVVDGGSWKPGLERLFAEVDIAICAEDCLPPDCASPDDVFAFLRGCGVAQSAITCGERPILYDDRGRRGEVRVEAVEAVDTLCAGDIFHGAFCYYQFSGGGGFAEVLELAARVATLSCRSFGTRSWIAALDPASGVR